MKLYQEHKVNPFASCLPLLAQLPVFISLFYLLQDDLRVEICPDAEPGDRTRCRAARPRESEFLFIPDITDNATGGVLDRADRALRRLAARLVAADERHGGHATSAMIFLALPFVFIPFIINFPAGLLVYWITTNLWTIVQQFIVRKTVGPVQTARRQRGAAADGGGGLPAAAPRAPAAGGRSAARGEPAEAARRGAAAAPRRAARAAAAAAVEAQEEAIRDGAADGRDDRARRGPARAARARRRRARPRRRRSSIERRRRDA